MLATTARERKRYCNAQVANAHTGKAIARGNFWTAIRVGERQIHNLRTICVESLAAVLMLRAGRCCVSLCCDLVIDHENENAFSFIPCSAGDADRVRRCPGSSNRQLLLVLRDWRR